VKTKNPLLFQLPVRFLFKIPTPDPVLALEKIADSGRSPLLHSGSMITSGLDLELKPEAELGSSELLK